MPELRFEEDHLRMLRGVRFAARFGFELEAGDPWRRFERSWRRIERPREPERVRDELTTMLTEDYDALEGI